MMKREKTPIFTNFVMIMIHKSTDDVGLFWLQLLEHIIRFTTQINNVLLLKYFTVILAGEIHLYLF